MRSELALATRCLIRRALDSRANAGAYPHDREMSAWFHGQARAYRLAAKTTGRMIREVRL